MQKLILLSDLWGDLNNKWLKYFESPLSELFEITYYDVRKLAGIDLEVTNPSEIHRAFVDFGMDKAIKELLSKEKTANVLIGVSIGGTIGWKAIFKGLEVDTFIGISATRLRYENERIDANIDLYFGENDPYQPDKHWFQKMNISPNIIKNEHHEMYRKLLIANSIISVIKGERHNHS